MLGSGSDRSAGCSSHSSGFNAVFADGSVPHLRYGVDPKVFKAACNRNGARRLTLMICERI
jgi:prepilin-type processing-associated H-X9-DG protein